MSESATAVPPRRQRREETAHRICAAAQVLTEQRGLDGFTLDELAAEVGVSRRTLFNYFPSKLDAVLGPSLSLDDVSLATFAGGGPHHDLVEDLIVLARAAVEVADPTREELERSSRILRGEPRLVARLHERFDELGTDIADVVIQREGADFGHERARLMLGVIVSTYDIALSRALARPGEARESFADELAECIRDVRRLFT